MDTYTYQPVFETTQTTREREREREREVMGGRDRWRERERERERYTNVCAQNLICNTNRYT